MEPVDIEEFRLERQPVPQDLRNSQLVYIAVLQSDVAIVSPTLPSPPYTYPEEVQKIHGLRAEHTELIALYDEFAERWIYWNGFLGAVALVDRGVDRGHIVVRRWRQYFI